jgi:hypothetical protein
MTPCYPPALTKRLQPAAAGAFTRRVSQPRRSALSGVFLSVNPSEEHIPASHPRRVFRSTGFLAPTRGRLAVSSPVRDRLRLDCAAASETHLQALMDEHGRLTAILSQGSERAVQDSNPNKGVINNCANSRRVIENSGAYCMLCLLLMRYERRRYRFRTFSAKSSSMI